MRWCSGGVSVCLHCAPGLGSPAGAISGAMGNTSSSGTLGMLGLAQAATLVLTAVAAKGCVTELLNFRGLRCIHERLCCPSGDLPLEQLHACAVLSALYCALL